MILGIDPGAAGAIAWLSLTGELLAVEDMPAAHVLIGTKARLRVSAPMLAALIRETMPTAAFVEKVGAMPGQGTASMFSFGFSAGLVDGVLDGLGIPTTYVTPQSWKKAAGLTSDKSAVRLRAAQLWPDMARHFARVKDDGRAEAALIARFGVTKC
jgi:crossover junction endodeoxyribonuclease RuvC